MTIQSSWQNNDLNNPIQITTISDAQRNQYWISAVSNSSDVVSEYPDPHQLLDSALAACTTLTLQLYAKRRGYALTQVVVTVEHIEEKGLYTLKRHVDLQGDLNDEQRADLMRVANKCPIHKVLSGDITIVDI